MKGSTARRRPASSCSMRSRVAGMSLTLPLSRLAAEQSQADGASIEPIVDLVDELSQRFAGRAGLVERPGKVGIEEFLAKDGNALGTIDTDPDGAGVKRDNLDRGLDGWEDDLLIGTT